MDGLRIIYLISLFFFCFLNYNSTFAIRFFSKVSYNEKDIPTLDPKKKE